MSDSAPVVDLVVDDLLGRAAAEGDLDLADELFALVAVAVGLGGREGHAEGLAAGDDRDLAHRVGALGEHPDQRVAGLVVGGALAVGVGHQHRAGGAEDDLLDRVGEVRQLDALVVAAGGEERRLVDQQREVGAGHARASRPRSRRGRRSRPAGPSACGCAGSPRGRCGRAAAPRSRRSKRPGRSSAGSRISWRLVAPRTMTLVPASKPSISVRIWLSVCSRSSWPPLKPPLPERERPMASSSSMKMIDGAASLACLKRSRTRDAPTPTIASTNSEAEIEKNGGVRLAGHGARQQRLARAGRPVEQHAARDARARGAGSAWGS